MSTSNFVPFVPSFVSFVLKNVALRKTLGALFFVLRKHWGADHVLPWLYNIRYPLHPCNSNSHPRAASCSSSSSTAWYFAFYFSKKAGNTRTRPVCGWACLFFCARCTLPHLCWATRAGILVSLAATSCFMSLSNNCCSSGQ